MKAVSFSDYGPPEVLRLADAEEPHAGEGQIRIAVRATGVNPIDWKTRSGAMRERMPLSFPVIDGREASGVVDEVGPGVSGVATGDEVFGFSVGGAAGAPPARSTKRPASWRRPLHVPVRQTFPFAQAAEAHRLSEAGHLRGKLVLVPG